MDVQQMDSSHAIEEELSKLGMQVDNRRRTNAFKVMTGVTLVLDAAVIFLAVATVQRLVPNTPESWVRDIVLAVTLIATIFFRRLYETAYRNDSTEYALILGSVNLGLLLDLAINRVANLPNFGLDAVVDLWLLLVAFLCVDRFILRRIRFSLMNTLALRQRALVVGITEESQWLVKQWAAIGSSGIEAIGFVEDNWGMGADPITGLPVLGNCSEIDAIIKREGIDSVLIANPELIHRQLVTSQTIMRTLSDVEVYSTTGIGDLLTSTAQIRELAFVPLVVLSKRRASGVHQFAKTLLDYTGTLLFLAFAIWPMMIIALLIRLDSPGPIIYRHKRIGLNDKPFYMLKFRSMYIDGNSRLTDEQREELRVNMKLKDDPRITKIGNFLRKTSLDEFPQLFNVLFGQMSWVGPRPLVEGEPEKFGQYRHLRTTVKPGLTGLWQVSGRSDLSYDERVLLDTYYVRNFTIWLDLDILLKTIPALMARRGAY